MQLPGQGVFLLSRSNVYDKVLADIGDEMTLVWMFAGHLAEPKPCSYPVSPLYARNQIEDGLFLRNKQCELGRGLQRERSEGDVLVTMWCLEYKLAYYIHHREEGIL